MTQESVNYSDAPVIVVNDTILTKLQLKRKSHAKYIKFLYHLNTLYMHLLIPRQSASQGNSPPRFRGKVPADDRRLSEERALRPLADDAPVPSSAAC